MSFIGVEEFLNSFAVHGMFILESIDITQELSSGLTRLPSSGKFVWSLRYARVEALSNNSFGWIGQ